MKIKDIYQYTKELSVLYIEDEITSNSPAAVESAAANAPAANKVELIP